MASRWRALNDNLLSSIILSRMCALLHRSGRFGRFEVYEKNSV
jgi:hypothetical protein